MHTSTKTILCCLFLTGALALTCYNMTNTNGVKPQGDKKDWATCTGDSCYKETVRNDHDSTYVTSWGCQATCQATSTDRNGFKTDHYCCNKDKCNGATTLALMTSLIFALLGCLVL